MSSCFSGEKPSECGSAPEAQCRTRTGDPLLTMEVRLSAGVGSSRFNAHCRRELVALAGPAFATSRPKSTGSGTHLVPTTSQSRGRRRQRRRRIPNWANSNRFGFPSRRSRVRPPSSALPLQCGISGCERDREAAPAPTAWTVHGWRTHEMGDHFPTSFPMS